jgi:hypothetical protein
MVQSVSPGRTVYFMAARGEAREAGTTICEPTSRRSGLRRPGFRASSCCQRRPLPRRDAANFQRESPGLTVTMVSFPEIVGDGETRGADGAGSTLGAKGAGTIVRGAETTGGASKTRGRSKGDRLTNGRNGATTRGAGLTTVRGTVIGGTKGWAGALGEASTGASAKGRRNSAER